MEIPDDAGNEPERTVEGTTEPEKDETATLEGKPEAPMVELDPGVTVLDTTSVVPEAVG